MTAPPDLRGELLRVLEAEASYPPMTPESLGRVLRALGYSPEPTEPEIVAALDALLAGGWIEAVHSARLGRRFRIPRTRPGRDLSDPGAAA